MCRSEYLLRIHGSQICQYASHMYSNDMAVHVYSAKRGLMPKQTIRPKTLSPLQHLYRLLGLFFLLLLTTFVNGISNLDPRLSQALAERNSQNALPENKSDTTQTDRANWLGQKAVQISMLLKNAGIEHATVYHRVKTQESAAEKVRRKGFTSVDQLNDLYGMRIVVNNELDVYRSLNVVCDQYQIVAGTLKNYIEAPKASGYQSVHVVNTLDGRRVEFQIRTQAMHEQAEAEHQAYKDRVRVAS